MLCLPIVSAWDPRATSSGSIDPLGALRAYNAIASFLLPGATTVTTRVRYLSWLCAGLCLLDELPGAPTGGQAGRARRQRLLAWERLVVLATGMYADDAGLPADHPAWSGLRGISYVKRAISERRRSAEYGLLTNQANVGGVGTYWVTLVNGGLVDDVPAALTARGKALADEFLGLRHQPSRDKLRRLLSGQYPVFKSEELVRWGEQVCLDTESAPVGERRALSDALLEPQAHRRLAGALGDSKHARSDHAAFARLHKRLRGQRDPLADQLAAVVEVTNVFESVHVGLLDRFDRLRSTSKLGGNVAFDKAVVACGDPGDLVDRGAALGRVLEANHLLPRSVSSTMRQFFSAVLPALSASTPEDLVIQLCRHHERVQSGKLDASRQPKQSWVSMKDRSIMVSPRFAMDGIPEARAAEAFTHPYRLESFAGMLSEVNGWEATK